MPTWITEPAISKAVKLASKQGRVELSDKGCEGLRLRIGAGGKKTWVLACRDQAGRMRRFPLGQHPDKGLADARVEARALWQEVKRDGADPIAARRAKRLRTPAVSITSLATLLEIYSERKGRQRKSWPEAQKRVEAVFAGQLNRPLGELTREELQIAADNYPAIMSASAGVRYLRPVLKWAEQRNYVPVSLTLLHPPATVQRRSRVLSDDELNRVIPALQASERPAWQMMHFLLLTMARRDEAASARWRDIDFLKATWSIPASNTKNSEPHLVPLSSQAIALLRNVARTTPLGDALVFSTASGGPLSNWDRENKLVHQATETTGWHRHDLRRTAATILGNLGEVPDVIEAALNHVNIRSPLAATYNRSRYQPQVRQALQKLGDFLQGVAEGQAGKIVALRRSENDHGSM